MYETYLLYLGVAYAFTKGIDYIFPPEPLPCYISETTIDGKELRVPVICKDQIIIK